MDTTEPTAPHGDDESAEGVERVLRAGLEDFEPVSYTHLTLPTIYSV